MKYLCMCLSLFQACWGAGDSGCHGESGSGQEGQTKGVTRGWIGGGGGMLNG